MLHIISLVGMGMSNDPTSEDEVAKREALIACAEYQSAMLSQRDALRHCPIAVLQIYLDEALDNSSTLAVPPSHAEALLDCFKNCSLIGWCCKEENSAFWRCYEQERVRHITLKAVVVLFYKHL